MSRKLKKFKEVRERIMDKKWEAFERGGGMRPRNQEENRKRAHEAHHGEGSYVG